MKRLFKDLSLAICLLFLVTQTQAATKYWDINDATAGAGGFSPAGIWNTVTTANWTTDLFGASAGTTWADNDDAVFSAGTDAVASWTVTIPAGTTNFANSVTVQEGTILMGPGTLSFGAVNGIFDIVGSTNTWNISGAGGGFVTGTGGITKNGEGVLLLGGSQRYTNSTSGSAAFLTINAGTVDFSGDVALGALPAVANPNAVTLNGGTLRFSGTTAVTLNVNRGVKVGASGTTIEVTSAASTGLSLAASATAGVLNGSGLLTKTGPGRFTENTASIGFTGKYKVLAGTLNVPGDGGFGLVPVSPVADYFILDGATAALRDAVTTGVSWSANRGITLGAGGGSLQQPGGGTTTDSLTYNGIIAGTSGGALRIQATDAAGGGTPDGIVILGGANTYDGATTVAAGMTLRLGAAGVIPDTSVVTLGGSGAIFDLNGFDETIKSVSGAAGTFAVGANTLTLANPAGETYSSVFTGTGKVVKNGSGTLTLSGSSTGFTGEFDHNNGTVGVGNVNCFGGTAGSGKLRINGGKIANSAATSRTMVIPLDIGGSFACDQSIFGVTSGQITFNSGAITLKVANPTITVDPAGYILPLGAVMADEGAGRGFTKAGAGIVSLNGAANTFSGNVTISAGAVNVDGDGSLGNGAGTLNLSGGNLTVTASRTVAVPNPINLTADSAITTSSTAASVDLDLSSSSIGGSSGRLTFRNDGADGASDTFKPRLSGGGFTFSRPITIDNGSVGKTELHSYNTTGTDQTFDGVISGTASYTRNASSIGTGGRTIFTQANDYSGGTTVNRGTLLVNNTTGSGTGSGAVTVNSDGTLGGTGIISGTVTVNSGGKLAPGASIGTLILDLSPTLNGTLVMEIDKGASPNADKLGVNSSLAFAGTLTVINTGAALTGGEVFDLFDSISIGGSFGAQNLPSLGAGLNWYTANLAANGTIKVNRAPTSGADTLRTATNTTASITLNKLMVNDSDADGDPFTMTEFSAASAQGGQVTFEFGTFNYAPPANFGGPDSFTYTLDDAHGGTRIVTVNVTVGGGSGQGANSVYAATEGSDFVVRFAGIPGETYTVEHSSSTSGPWSKLVNKTAPADNSLGFGIGVFEVREDTSAGMGFFRTVHPAYP